MNDQAFELLLPPHIKVHNVFHVSLLKKYVPDSNHILTDELPLVSKDGTLEVGPERILQKTRVRSLRNRELVEHLIQWVGYPEEDATWEREDMLVTDYPNFFSR